MHQRLQDAVTYVKNVSAVGIPDEERYRAECEYLVDHVPELTHRIFFGLPGGHTPHKDPAWDKVRTGSMARCDCGSERVIIPSNLRSEFEPFSGAKVLISKNRVYLRPLGGDEVSAYMTLRTEENHLIITDDPFAPLIVGPDMLIEKGMTLLDIESMLTKATPGNPLILFARFGTNHPNIPMFALESVDVVSQTITIVLDKDIETFEPNDHSGSPVRHPYTQS